MTGLLERELQTLLERPEGRGLPLEVRELLRTGFFLGVSSVMAILDLQPDEIVTGELEQLVGQIYDEVHRFATAEGWTEQEHRRDRRGDLS